MHREFSDTLSYYWRTQGSRPRLKFWLKFWIVVWCWASILLLWVFSVVISQVRQLTVLPAPILWSSDTSAGSIWSVTIMPAMAVSNHSHHKGQLKFLEETVKEDLLLFHETSYPTTKAFSILPIVWENVLKKEGMWRLVQEVLLTSFLHPRTQVGPTHSRTHQRLMSLPRKWYEGNATVCCAGRVLPERDDYKTDESSVPKQADTLFWLILELSLHIGCPPT